MKTDKELLDLLSPVVNELTRRVARAKGSRNVDAFLAQLPEVSDFTRKEALTRLPHLGLTPVTYDRWLATLVREGKLFQPRKGVYQRVTAPEK